MVLRAEAGHVGREEKWRRVSASDDRARDAAVEKLKGVLFTLVLSMFDFCWYRHLHRVS